MISTWLTLHVFGLILPTFFVSLFQAQHHLIATVVSKEHSLLRRRRRDSVLMMWRCVSRLEPKQSRAKVVAHHVTLLVGNDDIG
jgi:hypothetical protein